MQQDSSVRILGIAPYAFLPAQMGGQKGIEFFYRYLSKIEDTTVVSVTANAGELKGDYSLLKTFSNRKLRYGNPLLFFKLKKIIKEQAITHLICEHPYMGWLAIFLKKATGVKLIIHSHNIEGLRFKSSGKLWWQMLWNYERWVHRQADTNFFITHEDKLYAEKHFCLKPAACTTITYGTEINAAPGLQAKLSARKFILQKHKIPANATILLFNGTLNYMPNLLALDAILQTINPQLLTAKNFDYKIIICGKNLPANYNDLKDYKDKNIAFAGFVDEINEYFLAADIFINPVIEGGGIKTKLVEALGYNLSVVSTKSGAIGIPQNVTGDKLELVDDNDWNTFAKRILKCHTNSNIPAAFFNHFYWGNIAEKASKFMRDNA